MKKILRTFKFVLILILAGVLIWSLINYSLVSYGFSQLRGQMHIINSARPIDEMLADSAVSDSIKQKLVFINSVKQFAIDSLGLKASKNYTTFYDQKGKPLLWVITASEPFKLKAYHWKFPMLGSVSYKGFFEFETGKEEADELIEKGYDVEYDDVSAWSTLGWFKDPVLSNMINRSKGRLAELIIHEMTHSTIYIKSNVNFNENLASVCGEEGAIQFLRSKYGAGSEELKEYIFFKEDYDLFSRQMIAGTHKLDSLYSTITDSIVLIKQKMKNDMIRSIVKSLDTIQFHKPGRYSKLFEKNLPNNSYFLDFIRYDAQKDKMKQELNERFDGNISKYLDDLKRQYN